MESVPIVYRDERLLVLEKPTGLLSVPGRGADLQDCLARRVQAVFPSARIVHRLDRDTSGLLLMSLDPEAQRTVSSQFERREVRKGYVAVVAGVPRDEAGLIDLPIARDPRRPPRYRIDHERGRASRTRWRLLGGGVDSARLEVEPLTGRSHQIRLHLATLGHPVLGDPLYAPEAVVRRASRLMLHASVLAVAHPDDGRQVAWRSECPF
jgi:tRNA pseudouridine32 synthase/23S rRNA pseudouridine746 synthase